MKLRRSMLALSVVSVGCMADAGATEDEIAADELAQTEEALVTAGLSGRSDNTSDLLFYMRGGSFSDLYETETNGTMAYRRRDNGVPSADQVITGDFNGDAFVDVLYANFAAGRGDFYTTSGSSSSPLSSSTGWYGGWDTIASGNFNGDSLTDLFFFDYAAGFGALLTADGRGGLVQTYIASGLPTGYDAVIPGNFNGDAFTDLLFVDYAAGVGRFYTGNGTGGLTFWRDHSGWFTGWDTVVSGNFVGDAKSDLLFVDYQGGQAAFLSLDAAANMTQHAFYTGWFTGWDKIIAGQFNGASFDDLLFYDRNGGIGAIYTVGSGISMTQTMYATGWSTQWTDIVAAPNLGNAALAESFGYNHRPTVGTVPTLVVTINQTGAFLPAHSQAYFADLFFGTGSSPSVRRYFRENSRGRMDLVPASAGGAASGVMGPYAAIPVISMENYRKQAIDYAGQNGFNFAPFDSNGDGRVTNEELTVVLALSDAANTSGGAANRGTDPGCFVPTNNTIQVCLNVGSFGERESLITVAHELSHSWGTSDMYGGGANFAATLMSATPRGTDTWHLDPWHKMRFGWTRPRIVDIAQPGSCTWALSASAAGTAPSNLQGDPILIYDSARGRNEFFLVEYRARTGFDAQAAGTGVAVWHVKIRSDRALEMTPLYIYADDWDGVAEGSDSVLNSVRGGDDLLLGTMLVAGPNHLIDSVTSPQDRLSWEVMNNLFTATDGSLGVNAGWAPFWTQASGEFALRWPGNVASGINLRVGNTSGNSIAIRWRRSADPIPGQWSAASCFGAAM